MATGLPAQARGAASNLTEDRTAKTGFFAGERENAQAEENVIYFTTIA